MGEGWVGRTVRSSSTRASLPLSELVHVDMDADDPPRDVLVYVQTVRVHSMEKAQEMKKHVGYTCALR